MGETWSDRRLEAARAWLKGRCPECGHVPLIQRFDVPLSGPGEGDRDSDLCGFECSDCGWADTVDIGEAQQQVDDWQDRKRAEEEEEWEEELREEEAEEELGEVTWRFYRRVISDNPNTAFLPIDALEEHLKSQAVKELGERAPSARSAFGSWHTFAEEVFEARIASLRKQLLQTLWATLALIAAPLIAWWQASQLLEGGPVIELALGVLFLVLATLFGSALAAIVTMAVIGFLAASISGLVVSGLGQPDLARSRKADAWDRLTTSR